MRGEAQSTPPFLWRAALARQPILVWLILFVTTPLALAQICPASSKDVLLFVDNSGSITNGE